MVTVYDGDVIGQETEIQKREDCIAVLYTNRYGRVGRYFETEKDAEIFIKTGRVEYSVPQLSKNKKIRIIPGEKVQDEIWTERTTGTEILEEKIIGYHFGFFGKNLVSCETCFYSNWPSGMNQIPGGAIIVEIPAGTEITWYDGEFRCEILPGWNAQRIEAGWLERIKND